MENDGKLEDGDNSIHADVGGQYTERKIALANDTDIDLHSHDHEDLND